MIDCKALDFTLRTATHSDALTLAVLGMQVFMDTYATEGVRETIAREALESFDPETLAAIIQNPRELVLVAEVNRHVVGFAQVSLNNDHPMVDDRHAAQLKRLYVQERFTGRGVGWRLLRHAEAEALTGGASAMWATVWVGNPRALQFYPRQGYTYVGPAVHRLQVETHQNDLFCKPMTTPTRGCPPFDNAL
jgi:ribosomal protein S18 acetylase RimI-like enzyme